GRHGRDRQEARGDGGGQPSGRRIGTIFRRKIGALGKRKAWAKGKGAARPPSSFQFSPSAVAGASSAASASAAGAGFSAKLRVRKSGMWSPSPTTEGPSSRRSRG